MKKIFRKKLNKKGFTLAETLITVIILLLVSVIVATGIPSAKNAYERVVVSSNAQVLLSTAITALRDELGKASDVEVDEGKITYKSAATNATSTISLKLSETEADGTATSKKEGIVIKEYAGKDSGNERRLVSKAASNENLYIVYDAANVEYKNGVITIPKLKVMRDTDDKVLTDETTLQIRVLGS